jgi:hypothetical protein
VSGFEVYRQDGDEQTKIGEASDEGAAVTIACAFYEARQYAGETQDLQLVVVDQAAATIVAYIGGKALNLP